MCHDIDAAVGIKVLAGALGGTVAPFGWHEVPAEVHADDAKYFAQGRKNPDFVGGKVPRVEVVDCFVKEINREEADVTNATGTGAVVNWNEEVLDALWSSKPENVSHMRIPA